jgi:CheY-like chemotaxis protein
MRCAAAEAPDLVLLNLMMPHIDGLELLATIRADEALHDLPVVIVTGSTDGRTKQRAMAQGANDFLSKPIDPSELSLRVRNILTANTHRIKPPPVERPETPVLVEPRRRPRSDEPPLVSRLEGSGGRAGAIVSAFRDRLHAKLSEMESCAEQGAFEELQALAHWLKGAGGTVGFDEFTQPAESLRGLAAEHKREEIGNTIEELWSLASRISVPGEDAGRGAG